LESCGDGLVVKLVSGWSEAYPGGAEGGVRSLSGGGRSLSGRGRGLSGGVRSLSGGGRSLSGWGQNLIREGRKSIRVGLEPYPDGSEVYPDGVRTLSGRVRTLFGLGHRHQGRVIHSFPYRLWAVRLRSVDQVSADTHCVLAPQHRRKPIPRGESLWSKPCE